MLRKRAAHQKKVASAVRVLQTTTGVNVLMAMILAGFSKSDITDKIMRQQVRCRLALMGVTDNNQREVFFVDVDKAPSLSDFTSDKDASLSTTSASSSSAPTNPKPKTKQIRPTASAVQQRRVGNLAAKKHKSDAHKAAIRQFDAEKKKPDGMSIRQVHDVIASKYETCPSIATISRYVAHGLVNVSSMKMGPEGHVSAQAYKNLCQAYSSLVPINQMNACAGDNSRKMLIPMLMKTFDIGTIDATGLLNHVVRDTAIDINAVRLNCAEDRRIRWTTYQNLALWFDSWEAFYRLWVRDNQRNRRAHH
jgi:hypothetical protein